MAKVVEVSKCWLCNSVDYDAPIFAEGFEALLDNGETVRVWDDVKYEGESYEWASEEERKEFYRKEQHYVFPGDKVKIVRGKKMVGEEKTIASVYVYTIPGTYGKGEVEYLRFTDGTSVNMHNVESKFPYSFYSFAKSLDEVYTYRLGGQKLSR